MKFKFYVVSGNTYLEAFFEESDVVEGNRLEGAGVKIRNRNPLVFFNQDYSGVHPDIIGLACLAIFYPFIGSEVTFPYPVSQRLVNSINREIFTKTKSLKIKNIDTNIPQYQGNGKAVLAFGGGVDSSAVRALFPEAFVIHEASIRDGEEVLDLTNSVVEKLENEGKGRLVKTNSRFISDPGGWHIWIGSIVTALLEGAKSGSSYIYSGTILGSAFMSNGNKYFDRHASSKWHGESGNYWQQIFWDIGLPLVQPLMGCSEILTTEATVNAIPKEEVFFCTAKDGGPCGVCPKCFRRACIQDYLGNKKLDFTSFDNIQVNTLLDRKPTYFGHIYSSLLVAGWTPPDFVKHKLQHLPGGSSFCLKYNPESLDFMPLELRGDIKAVLERNFNVMNEGDIKAMRGWNQAL